MISYNFRIDATGSYVSNLNKIKTNDESDPILIMVGEKKFSITRDKLRKFPNTLLGKCANNLKNTNVLEFPDENPDLFHLVLYYYENDGDQLLEKDIAVFHMYERFGISRCDLLTYEKLVGKN